MKIDKNKVQLRMAEISDCSTQAKLADKAGVSRQTMSAVMRGRNCRPEILGRISFALGVKPEDIVE